MADQMRNYFDSRVPVEPPHSFSGGPRPGRRTWQTAWNNLSKQLFVVMPNQLDRTRVNRNKFLKAVK